MSKSRFTLKMCCLSCGLRTAFELLIYQQRFVIANKIPKNLVDVIANFAVCEVLKVCVL